MRTAVETRGHQPLPIGSIVLVVAVAALMALLLPPTAFASATPTPVTGPTFGQVAPLAIPAPAVALYRTFDSSTASATSTSFPTAAGETIVVFASLFGTDSASVTVSSPDTFVVLGSASQGTATSGNSLWMFAAYDVAATSAQTLTVTESGPSTASIAAEFVVVSGVGPTPLDHVGTPTNYSSAKSAATATVSVPASASDLVLGAVSAHETHSWSAAGTDTLLDNSHEPVSTAPMTAVDLFADAATAGSVWVNATNPSTTTKWLADGVSLLAPSSSSSTGRYTFSELGLPSGQAWYVLVGSTVYASTSSKVAVNGTNGTHAFTISPISGFVATPSSGKFQIGGPYLVKTIRFVVAGDDWPTYMGEVTRNSANPNETVLSSADATNLTELWSASTSYVQSEPVERNDVVYAGSTNGYEYALNATTGAVIWKTFVGEVYQPGCNDQKPQGLTSSATEYRGMVYVGGGNDSNNYQNGTANWYALNATTGAIVWNIPIGEINQGYYNWASPLVIPGYAYVGVASRCSQPQIWGGLLQVSLTTHSVVAYFNTTVGGHNTRGSSIWGSPTYVAATNTVYVATGNPLNNQSNSLYSESVVAVNATTLAPIGTWMIPASQAIRDSDFGNTPDYYHLPSGRALVSAMNKNGILYALNATNVTAGPYWEQAVANAVYPQNVAPQAWGDGLLFDGTGPANVSGIAYNGSLRALNPGTGVIKWSHGFPGDVYGAPAYADGIVVAGGGDALEVFNASDGQLLFKWICGASFNSGPSIADGRIYADCLGTYAFGLSGVAALPPVHAGGASFASHPGAAGIGTGLGGISAPPTYAMARPVEATAPRAPRHRAPSGRA
jgi:outer membrane protein assembly factor BamB